MWLREYNDLPVVLYQSGEIVGYVETVHYLMGEKHLQGISFRKKGKAHKQYMEHAQHMHLLLMRHMQAP